MPKKLTEEFKQKLHRFKIDTLSLLHLLCSSKNIAINLEEISQSTSTPEGGLKGIISTIRRIRVNNNQSIITPAGKDRVKCYCYRGSIVRYC